MMKRNVGAMVVGGVVVIAAGIASCSFPTYNINVTGGAGGGATSASASSGSVGSGGEASATTSSGSVGGGASASSAASGAGGSSSASTGSGACTTDADGDGAISAACIGGTDCADGDPLANPKGTYHSFAIKNPPMGTSPYDFNCNGKEEYEITTVINCAALPCNTTTVAWKGAVPACGVSGQYGTCKLGTLSCNEDIQGTQQQKCR